MTRIVDITKPRRFRPCCARIRKSPAVRLIVAAELRALKLARGIVDSRLRKMGQTDNAQERQSEEP